MDNYQKRSYELARRFLQTAVVVDDKAYMALEQDNVSKGHVVEPGRIPKTTSGQNDAAETGPSPQLGLDAAPVIDSFLRLGVICGVVSPAGPTREAMLETMKKADIVVLDWFLQDGNHEYTLKLLEGLLAGESDQNSLRLVSIYTGQPELDEIRKKVYEILCKANLNPKSLEDNPEISYQHGRVVLYAKSDVNLAKPFNNRNVKEENLPEKLVNDFASMTSGLLPRIALTSLTAVRENEHKLLDRFGGKLDPAFLAHKSYLPNPEDAERQIVNCITEELRGLMDNAVAETSSEDVDAVEHWIREKAKEFSFCEKTLNQEDAIELATKGLKNSQKLSKNFKCLSAGFSGNNHATDLDKELAWIMAFRAVYSASKPRLWLGSVVTELSNGGKRHLICMRPRCDCVRLKEETTFLFFSLSLVEPTKKKKQIKEQIIVKINNEFKQLKIESHSNSWVLQKFQPSTGSHEVIAKKETNGHFEFKDSDGKQYEWIGELKAEYAQRIAQNFAAELSRVAIDESEWLRRMRSS